MTYLKSCPDCGTKRTKGINKGGDFELQVFYNQLTGKRLNWFYTCWVCDPEEGHVI